jgi:hypothetical protein
MARDEQAIENEIQAKGLNAPRLTPAHIDAQIVGEYSVRASEAFKGCPGAEKLSCLTIAVLRLKNGFIVVGESACASPENYDAELGHKIARDNARNKIWALEGYALRSRLAAP